VPVILAGLKKDLRDNPVSAPTHPRRRQAGEAYVTKESGERMARRIGALYHIECSSLTGEGVKEIFEVAAVASLSGSRRKAKETEKRKTRLPRNCNIV